jgi:hypothetical protein
MSYDFSGRYIVDPATGCWNWAQGMRDGRYGVAHYQGRPHRAHRLSFECFSGSKIPSGMEVRHKCDNMRCINPNHLELGTRQDNVNDKMQRGRHKTKLSKDDVEAIRSLLGTKSQTEIARSFGICQQQVSRIKSRENWA